MKILQIEYARAFASLAVVLFHVQITMEKYFGIGLWKGLESGNSGVQVFFVISGFVMMLVHKDDPQGSWRALKLFAQKRFERIYIPLWIVLAPLTVVALHDGVSWYDVLAAWAVIPAPSDPVLAVEWTLRHEILFYCVFMFYIFNRRLGFLALMAWGVIGSIAGLFFSEPWLLKFLLHPNHLLFLLGMGLATVWRANVARHLAWPLLVFGSVMFFGTWFADAYFDPEKGAVILSYGIGFTILCLGLLYTGVGSVSSRVGLMLAEASYAIYLVHFPVIVICCKVFARFPIAGTAFEIWIMGLAAAALSVGSGVAFHVLLEKPALSILRKRRQRLATKTSADAV